MPHPFCAAWAWPPPHGHIPCPAFLAWLRPHAPCSALPCLAACPAEKKQKKEQKEEAEKHLRLARELEELKTQYYLWQVGWLGLGGEPGLGLGLGGVGRGVAAGAGRAVGRT